MNYMVTFGWIKSLCPFCKPGFDEMVGYAADTCRHNDNKPKGCSWGECNEDICPLLKNKKEI